MNLFKQYNFQEFIMNALDEKKFLKPTEVQEKLIPVVMQGKNVVGQSQTGSGKTHTFLLPMMNAVDPEKDEVQGIITTPSRELAEQIYQAAVQLAKHSEKEIRVSQYVGGTDKKRQMEKLKTSQPHIVIGTPGRILDLVNNQSLKTFTANHFVVDEADMTLDMGFLEDVDKIAATLPKGLQMLVFSATIPTKLKPFLKKYMDNPVVEHIKPSSVISDTIDNWAISTKGQDVNKVIYQLLNIGQPYLVMVFANTKQRVNEISTYLKEQGLKVATIHGDIPPRERKRVMKNVQNLDFQFVVATDLAARGIDIEGVSHVINTEIPTDLEFFIHRVGRTGRNGLEGTAITLYQPSDENSLAELEKLGIEFHPKVIRGGEIIDSYDRNRREKRDKSQKQLDISMIGLVKKKKKKVKPGYKKKLQYAIDDNEKQKRKIDRRQTDRAKRKSRKQDY
ncbi:DEAD/DEAH box helicase [Vagococcus hydrophili]|uniref:DEAD-box ATP-dependent RNA helicase CshB n=1 Tax=Vagococcus hydrophili TaxID=2714947 RepID=A0A6G8AWY4_9ENTE|nr:DEAD/DEAH box helicase [Vagococcus hydrophili]QIL49403.1 DEAD/DEAH box helicase [Vagococcus hydrophili]